MTKFSPYLKISSAVKKALDKKEPIVALESTIIAHGMPFPKNLKVAKEVEHIIHSTGATPATIAILNGKIKIGLTKEEMTFIAKEGSRIPKVSRRDLPLLIAQNNHGATTVATTMIAADMAGIRIFATGGIGGVHRGGEKTLDISADLQELANTNVAVICGGAKAMLNLPLTLEYMETHGIPVIGVGTNEFPAFYSRNSGLTLEYRLDTAEEIANILRTKWDLNLKGGVVIANPIPEEYSLDHKFIMDAVDQAIQIANKNNIQGKNITPFLLSTIEEITKGKSLESNIQLVFNNARLAAEIAKKL